MLSCTPKGRYTLMVDCMLGYILKDYMLVYTLKVNARVIRANRFRDCGIVEITEY